ncbi:MAG TPA: NADH-quinone oxidoreductase subunit C [Oleiagrimonas sp.]|nr:NADH-quinone oxidoreductase subunit C [Oleiagrimonas sp.]
MTEQQEDTRLAGQLRARFGDKLKRVICERGETTIEVTPANLIEIATALRDEAEFRFASFIDICGVDYLSYGQVEWDTDDVTATGFSRGVEGQSAGRFDWEERPDQTVTTDFEHRFASVMHLLSLEHNMRLRVRVFCEDDHFPVVPSVTSLWTGANWFERESFDLFGIIYDGHPDLRRILTDYGFVGHPFRKDFPLIGNVEVRYDPEAGRVIYEPVSSVEPRVLVPRVIRDDSDLLQAQAEAADHWQEN